MDPAGVFVSYRRADALGSAHGVHRELVRALRRIDGHDRREVFLDIDDIEPGLDFRDVIRETLRRCPFVLVIIGPRWLHVTDPQGRRRLDVPSDTHVLEIAGALEAGAHVVPVLVEDAAMPTADDLPERIRDLSYRNAWVVDHRRFDHDVEQLAARLAGLERRRAEEDERAETERREREQVLRDLASALASHVVARAHAAVAERREREGLLRDLAAALGHLVAARAE